MSFDGTMKNVINLSKVFKCVKGNNPRSFSFMVQTSQTTEAAIIETGTWSYLNTFTIGIGWNGRKTTAGTICVFGNGGAYSMTSPAINDNQWHSVIVSFDGTSLRIFIDNILVCGLLISCLQLHLKRLLSTTLSVITTTLVALLR